MYDIILAFITAFSLTFLAIPSIISIAKKKNLMDEPGERRSHTVKTPSLGGIAIFAGMLFSIILWTPFEYFGDLQYILCAFIIIFLIGAKDDIDPIAPRSKLFGELFAAAILVFRANVRLTSLYGILGIHELPYVISVLLSIFTIIVIINAFNLIDGINGLSGGIGTLISVLLGLWFLKINRVELAMVAFSLAGSLVAFLYYNVTPAKIFMGDTGSLFIGFSLAFFIVLIVNGPSGESVFPIEGTQLQVLCLSALILPCFDTIRVMLSRVLRRKSPFKADRSHLHHLLWKTGLRANGIAICFALGTLFFFLEAFLMAVMGVEAISILFAVILTAVLAFNGLIIIRIRQHQKKMQAYEYQLEAITIKNYLVQKN